MRDDHTARRRRALHPPRHAAPPEPQPFADSAPAERAPAERDGGAVMLVLRYALPTVVAIGGLVVMAFGTETDLEGGAGILSAGLAIYFINWLFRAGVAGDLEREREAQARDYFDRHGRWPS